MRMFFRKVDLSASKLSCFRKLMTLLQLSSSSALAMTVTQSACKHPERCVTCHTFNPPQMISLVDVVASEKTSPETIVQKMSFYASIGKKPIHVRKEIAGHIADRLQAALYREVAFLIDQGVMDVADADAIVCWGPELRWGVMDPSVLFHLGGGKGGIQRFIDHLSEPFSNWLKVEGPRGAFGVHTQDQANN
jgi:3-hydroxyacyl-CoA dehydrogenase